MVGISPVRSRIVDSNPIVEAPPSNIISIFPSKSSMTCSALVVLGRPEELGTVVQQLDRKNLKEEDFFVAGELIRKGKLVAFPTETVYGLGAENPL